MRTAPSNALDETSEVHMKIDDDLIKQWEPQVHKVARTVSVVGMDYEDIVQELRIGVMKAAKGYKEDSGVLFHTYLYKTLMNTASTLITKASKQYRAMPIVDMPDNFENKLQDLNPQTSTLEIVDMLKSLDLSYIEKAFIRLRMQGYSMKELGENLDIKGVYRLNKQIKQKVREQLGKEREANN
jgi:RNA polymerase sigma factor (sigma-70 family)